MEDSNHSNCLQETEKENLLTSHLDADTWKGSGANC